LTGAQLKPADGQLPDLALPHGRLIQSKGEPEESEWQAKRP
jgi:hypothetical protein